MWPKGFKRYWVVTGINPVTADIKANTKKYAKEPVWTRDFTTMYTNLDHKRIFAGVMHAVQEAFAFHNKDENVNTKASTSNTTALAMLRHNTVIQGSTRKNFLICSKASFHKSIYVLAKAMMPMTVSSFGSKLEFQWAAKHHRKSPMYFVIPWNHYSWTNY